MSPTEQEIVRVVAGVVDKVPGAGDHSKPASMASEGFSVLLSNSHMLQDRKHYALNKSDSNQELSHPAVLRFSSKIHNLGLPATNQADRDRGVRQIHVPVANTLFVNGRASTLFESLWRRSARPTSEGYGLCLPPRSLKGCNIDVSVYPREFFQAKYSMDAVTPPRLIKAAMGNVIREIELEGKGVPASSELEPAASHLAKSRGDGKILVFALVWPIRHAIRRSHGRTNEPSLRMQIEHGARLYRVTGGGGGWGSKRGLLSLEPSTSFEDLSARKEHTIANSEQAQQDDLPHPALMDSENETVRAGEIVRFYAYVSNEHGTGEASKDSSDGMEPPKKATALSPTYQVVLGNIDRAEFAVDEADQEEQTKNGNDIQHIKNTFGAFSERGVGLVARKIDQATRPIGFLGARASSVLSSTKFDVPDTRFPLPVYLGRTKLDFQLPSSGYEPEAQGVTLRSNAEGKQAKRKAARASRAKTVTFDATVPGQGVFADLGIATDREAKQPVQKDTHSNRSPARPRWET